MWSYLVMTLLAFLGVLLMFIVLLQKGRGGGLAGAFGGMGGQSAFGTRAGDVFTKITVGLAAAWIILAAASGFVLRAEADRRYPGADESETPAATTTEDGEAPPPPVAPKGATETETPKTENATEPEGDAKTEPAPSETNEPEDSAKDKKAEGTGTSSDAPASEPSPE